MRRRHLSWLAGAIFPALALASCSNAPPKLADVQVPADFIFATSRGVDVQVTAPAASMPPNGIAPLVIKRPDGSILFEGPIRSDQAVAVRLAVPGKDQKLVAELYAGGTPRTLDLPISGTAAAGTFP